MTITRKLTSKAKRPGFESRQHSTTCKTRARVRFQVQGLLRLQPTLAGAVVGDPARVSNRELRDELLLLQVRAMQPPRAGPLRLPLHEAARRHREPQRLVNTL